MRKKANRRGVRRKRSGIPAWLLLFGGVLIGLGASYFFLFDGSLSDLKDHLPMAGKPAEMSPEASQGDEPELTPKEEEKPRFDFFTVLPGMEVVVPEQELAKRAQPSETESATQDTEYFVLQVGSFRSSADAEQMKAQLALSGIVADIQSVKINDSEWHRVRIGPVSGARKTDEMRLQLQNGGFDPLVMKANP
jgi:cell division protein FtsN